MAKLPANATQVVCAKSLPLGSGQPAAVAQPSKQTADKQHAQREMEAKLKQAFEQARLDGLAKGQSKASADFQERLEAEKAQLRQLETNLRNQDEERRQQFDIQLRALADFKAQLEREAESMAVEMAYRAALRLIQVRAEDRTLLAEACTVASLELGTAALRIRVPTMASELLHNPPRSGLEVIVDGSLRSDQCFIETARGQSEAGLATRLENLKNALLAQINDGGSGVS